MTVVDASCVVEVLLRTGAADVIETRWKRGGGLQAPEVVDLEVLQVLRRLVAMREMSEDRAVLAVGALERLALRRWSHVRMRRRIWALRKNLTAYDAAYVALAERLGCPLITRDGRLARSAGHDARIETAVAGAHRRARVRASRSRERGGGVVAWTDAVLASRLFFLIGPTFSPEDCLPERRDDPAQVVGQHREASPLLATYDAQRVGTMTDVA